MSRKAIIFSGCQLQNKEGVVLDCPDEGKLTVEFETLGTLKINRCYLKPVQ